VIESKAASRPIRAARAYLTVIARDPQAVRKALNPPLRPHP
jgi:hypothetical protein